MKARTLAILFLTIFLTVSTDLVACDADTEKLAEGGKKKSFKSYVPRRDYLLIPLFFFAGIIGANYETTIFPWLLPEESQQADSDENGWGPSTKPALTEKDASNKPSIAGDTDPFDPNGPRTR